MHESLMTPLEVVQLHRDVEHFYLARRGTVVSIADANDHFERLGYELTRPIEHTLQAHGVVAGAPSHLRPRYQLLSEPWRIAGDRLVPCEPAGSEPPL